MKNYGKVTKYNGVYGEIRSIDGDNYTLLDKNIVDSDLKESDKVEFESENFKTHEVEMNIARFVRVIKKEELSNSNKKN